MLAFNTKSTLYFVTIIIVIKFFPDIMTQCQVSNLFVYLNDIVFH